MEEALEARVKDLEKQLSNITFQRDELQRDVESLCMQGSMGSTFSASSVLSDRIITSENELAKTKKQLSAAIAERENLKEDLHAYKDSKRQVDNSWRAEREKTIKLSKELNFYQGQSARAMADRDKASWEAEELRSRTLHLEARLREAESRAESEKTQRVELEGQLASTQKYVEMLEVKAEEATIIPSLKLDLATALGKVVLVEKERSKLQSDLYESEAALSKASLALALSAKKEIAWNEELQQLTDTAQKADREHAAEMKDLKEKLAAETAARIGAESRAETAESTLVSVRAEAEGTSKKLTEQLEEQKRAAELAQERLKREISAEVITLRKDLEAEKVKAAEAVSELEQASAQKVRSLLALSGTEQQRDGLLEAADQLKDEVYALNAKLTQAAKEKVAALAQVAELKKEIASQQQKFRELKGQVKEYKNSPATAKGATSPWGAMWGVAARTTSGSVTASAPASPPGSPRSSAAESTPEKGS